MTCFSKQGLFWKTSLLTSIKLIDLFFKTSLLILQRLLCKILITISLVLNKSLYAPNVYTQVHPILVSFSKIYQKWKSLLKSVKSLLFWTWSTLCPKFFSMKIVPNCYLGILEKLKKLLALYLLVLLNPWLILEI